MKGVVIVGLMLAVAGTGIYIPRNQLGDGTPTATTVLMGDATWDESANLCAAQTCNFADIVATGDISCDQFTASSATYPPTRSTRTSSATNTRVTAHSLRHSSSATMADGFGVLFDFVLRDDSGVDNQVVFVGAKRSGADNSGTFYIEVANAGSFTERFTIDNNGRATFTSTGGGLLPPRMTTAQRDAMTPTASEIIYNTTTGKHQGYNGAWNDLY